MEQQDLIELTILIDNCDYNNEPMITVERLHERLWPGLKNLRTATNKDDLIANWKYGSDITATERSHTNNGKHFTRLDWEKSYVLAFWMGIYH